MRKYVHEVQLQEHLDNMRATQQQLSPEGARELPPPRSVVAQIVLPQPPSS